VAFQRHWDGDKLSDDGRLWIALADWDDMHFLLFGDEGVLLVNVEFRVCGPKIEAEVEHLLVCIVMKWAVSYMF
jgi:hypothetical protein